MLRIVKTEWLKLKRYHILWAGVMLMLLSVVLTLFTSLAKDGTVWDFRFLAEQVIRHNATTLSPVCLTLITGFLISREEKDDTLKNILTIPLSFKRLLVGKLLICGGLALFFGAVCSLFTILACIITGFPGFTPALALQAVGQLIAVNFFLYLAVLPIIVLSSRANPLVGVIVSFAYGYGGMFAVGDMTLACLYPITASLGLIHYRSYDPAVHWNSPLCLGSLLAAVLLSALFLFLMRDWEIGTGKGEKKPAPKKGW